MSRTLVDRDRLIAGLEGAGIRTATGGQLSAPCVLIEPGDPWSEPRRMPGRVSRWQLAAIAGRADTTGAYAELAELIDTIDAGIRTVPGCELPTWAAPADVTLGIPYAAAIATIEIATA